ncbi:cytochrome-c peroxidase [Pacificoceanicola onchidii]|uniref:cytochrome-c peroxidase n=1 Tax=Pacificoceanicola onchidii TaxID=2562685 RepID=UPI001F10DFA9|nr:cytochrome c peroxidase [Pacificoceanicola onchidii]
MALLGLVWLAGPAASETMSQDDFLPFDPAQAKIGQLLFYDKILSGNRNISCATCHHPSLGSADGLSLGIGEGGVGLGPERTAGSGGDRIKKRIPRNAPALWNLGHRDVRVLFHDGRVQQVDYRMWTFDTPAGERLPKGLNSILAAQALFPMTSDAEMAGQAGENEISGAIRPLVSEAWPIIAKRVRGIPDYAEMFQSALPHIETAEDVTIVDIANALAAFIGTEFQSFDSPYDAYVQTGAPLPDDAERGRQLFFGKAQCAACHNGPLFSDQGFHATGTPQFGPGRTRMHDKLPRDLGRMGTTDLVDDAYKFRTPSLRNIALTAPYGHNGAYPTLKAMIRHMANAKAERALWRPEMAQLPNAPWLADIDFILASDRLEIARQTAAVDMPSVSLTDAEIADLEAFLNALTGTSVNDLPFGVPAAVPSGLPVD